MPESNEDVNYPALNRVIVQLEAANAQMSALITAINDQASLADIVTQLEESNTNMLALIAAVEAIT